MFVFFSKSAIPMKDVDMGKISLFLSLIILLTISFKTYAASEFHLNNVNNLRTIRFEMENDSIRDRDSHFTNGWSLQYHSRLYDSWENASAPDFIKWIGQHFPSLNRTDSVVRNSFGIGQTAFTPEDLTERNPPEGELPYAGTLTGSLSWQSFNRDSARIFQISIGIHGEESLSGKLHIFSHNDLHMGNDPEGWDSQRDTEPILNLAYQYNYTLARSDNFSDRWGWHLALGPSASLGNLTTDVKIDLLLRYGWNIIEGFGVTPTPPGFGIFQSTQIPKSEINSPHSFEIVMGIGATALFYSVIYDGSLITDDDRDVARDDTVLSGLVGLNYQYKNSFSVRAYLLATSDLLESDSIPSRSPGDKTFPDPSYAALSLDYHF
jgi:lipid A 3-O-deacylase